MNRLERAVSEKGPNGEKSCSHMESWEPPSDKLRQLLLEEHPLETWLSKDGPIVAYAKYYIGRCKNYNWDQRVYNIYLKTVRNLGRARRPMFVGRKWDPPAPPGKETSYREATQLLSIFVQFFELPNRNLLHKLIYLLPARSFTGLARVGSSLARIGRVDNDIKRLRRDWKRDIPSSARVKILSQVRFMTINILITSHNYFLLKLLID